MTTGSERQMPECLPGEEWRPVPFASNYVVSSVGRVATYLSRGCSNNLRTTCTIMRQQTKRGGYKKVGLNCDDGTRRHHSVHTLVLLAFRGPKPPGTEARHLDNNPSNNRRDNLEWATPQINMNDQIKFGTRPLGAERPNAKLSDAQVLEIRKAVRRGENHSVIATRYGVAKTTIRGVASGKLWKHVPTQATA